MSSNKVIVWEWKDDRHTWRAYEPHVSNFIEQNRTKGGNTLNLGPADIKLKNYNIDVAAKKQINSLTGGRRGMRRRLYDEDSALGSGVLWQFETDENTWDPYDPEFAEVLEEAVCRGDGHVDMSLQDKRKPYVIDLTAMTQTRKKTNKVRMVRRISQQARYVPDTGSSLWDAADISRGAWHNPDTSDDSSRHPRGKAKHNTNRGAKQRSTSPVKSMQKPKETRPPISTKPACEYQELCQAFRDSLKLSKAFFNGRYDKCYCSSCYTGSHHATFGDPPRDFSLPIGWYRFSLSPPSRAFSMKAFEKWHRGFHGTTKANVNGILEVGEIAPAGRSVLGGKVISEAPGHFTPTRKPAGFDTKQIFVSPSIHYSSHDTYAPTSQFTCPKTNKRYNAKVAFQVLINPSSYKVGPETLAASSAIDPVISNQELEWMTSQQGSTILYGLLVKLY